MVNWLLLLHILEWLRSMILGHVVMVVLLFNCHCQGLPLKCLWGLNLVHKLVLNKLVILFVLVLVVLHFVMLVFVVVPCV